jgi:hypothetical protein
MKTFCNVYSCHHENGCVCGNDKRKEGDINIKPCEFYKEMTKDEIKEKY